MSISTSDIQMRKMQGICIIIYKITTITSGGSRIFPGGGAPTPKIAIIFHIFAENCMKMKEFGPPGGARVPGAPPWIRQ